MSGTANPGWSKAKYAARGVHLDQDAAGRLLESMSDRARREMIVRIARAVRQNPAYRPFAADLTTSDRVLVGGCPFSEERLNQKRTTIMRSTYYLLLVPFLAGCASTQAPQPGIPTQIPSAPAPIATKPGSWTFSFAPGPVAYHISRTAAIESSSDSSRREITTNSTYEALNLQPGIDTIRFTAAVDTFSTTTQGVIQSVQLPVQLVGSLVEDSLTILADSLTENCNPVTTVLITD